MVFFIAAIETLPKTVLELLLGSFTAIVKYSNKAEQKEKERKKLVVWREGKRHFKRKEKRKTKPLVSGPTEWDLTLQVK